MKSDLLQQDARPWLPSDHAAPAGLLNEYDVPLIGLLRHGGSPYLYACLLGELERLNVWAYARISEQEFDQLTRLAGAELRSAVDQALQDRPLIIALAADYKLVDWATVNAGSDDLTELVGRFLNSMRTRANDAQQDIEQLESQLRN